MYPVGRNTWREPTHAWGEQQLDSLKLLKMLSKCPYSFCFCTKITLNCDLKVEDLYAPKSTNDMVFFLMIFTQDNVCMNIFMSEACAGGKTRQAL